MPLNPGQKDTSLYPIVKIVNSPGNAIYISTNSVTIAGNYYHPMLLNVPSLKESIDIESRRYKISNMTLDISNYKAGGIRFTDLVNNSLINQSVEISWVFLQDNAWIAYRGVVRRYDVGSDNIKLTVEDRSQATLHRDLPLENVGTRDTIPDKYKNKYVPLVYGKVEHSPVVPWYTASDEIDGTEGEVQNLLELRLRAETKPIIFNTEDIPIGTALHRVSALYFYENDGYHNVHETNEDFGDGLDSGIPNFRYTDMSIILDVYGQVPGAEEETEDLYMNDFAKGHLRVHAIRNFTTIETVYDGDNQYSGNINFDTDGYGLGRIYGSLNLSVSSFPNHDVLLDWSGAHLKCTLEPITVPNNIAVDEDGNQVQPITRLLTKIDHYNFSQLINVSPQGGTDNIPSVVNSFGTDDPDVPDGAFPSTHWGVWGGGQGQVRYGTGSSYGNNGVSSYFSQQTIYPHSFNTIEPGNFTIGGTSYEGDEIDLLSWFDTLTSFDHVNIGIPKHRMHADTNLWDTSVGGSLPDEGDDITWGVDTTIHNAYIAQTYFIMGITDKDYYANITGRLGDAPQASAIIGDILTEELAMDAPIVIDSGSEYDNWKYAFSQPDKISSKALIEGIASASPFLPHFNNQGVFKVDIIKQTYTYAEIQSSQRILTADCISWSYSRTPIEDVISNINLKFSYDHARGDFNDNIEMDVDALPQLVGYSVGYYGLDGASDYPQFNYTDSTLIDEERGKYINDADTAGYLAKWLLYWHCNQHLKIKVRLPISYIDISVGSLCSFDGLLDDVKPYGINYSHDAAMGDGIHGSIINGQQIYSLFMCIDSNKTLDYCEFTLLQLHNLSDEQHLAEGVYGCTNSEAWNYDSNADYDDYSCVLPTDFVSPSCPIESVELENGETLYSDNYTDFDIDDAWVFSDTIYNDVFAAAEDYYNENLTDIASGTVPEPVILLQSNCQGLDWIKHNLREIRFLYYDSNADFEDRWVEFLVISDPQENDYSANNPQPGQQTVPMDAQFKEAYINPGGDNTDGSKEANSVGWRLQFVFDTEPQPTFEADEPIFFWNVKPEGVGNVPHNDWTTQNEGVQNLYTNETADDTMILETPGILHFVLNEGGEFPDPGQWDNQGYIATLKMWYKMTIHGFDDPIIEFERSLEHQNEIHFDFVSIGETPIVMGDITGDGLVNVLDVVALASYALGGNTLTPAQEAAGDMNGDGIVNVLDIVQIVNIILGGGDG